MALVKVLVANLFAGASLQKLEAGQVYDVDDSIAEKWIEQGRVEKSTEKKGEKLVFAVATPSSPVASDLQSKLNEALAQLEQARSEIDAKDKEHAEVIEQLKQESAVKLDAETKRADEAEAALAEATKKAK
ncbi:hypothetical protein [Klebsiella aerogenes]|uniref:hypothetical protein n=1 Tax=Klebsiella aerogenes TaxID=548 RepID=UPI000D3D0DDA|nr:hypothetical protein [Klebsiella aerogenes]